MRCPSLPILKTIPRPKNNFIGARASAFALEQAAQEHPDAERIVLISKEDLKVEKHYNQLRVPPTTRVLPYRFEVQRPAQ